MCIAKGGLYAYTPKYFVAQEFVSRHAYSILGSQKCLRYFNPLLLLTADQLRERFGPATINNWFFGGERQFSGLRLPNEPHYSPRSDHSYGEALDIIFKNQDAKIVREYIEANPNEFPHITFIEEGEDITWLHISTSPMVHTFPQINPNALVFWNKDSRKIRVIERS